MAFLFKYSNTTKLSSKTPQKNTYHFSTDELHNSLDLLKVEDIADQEVVTLVHNYFSNRLSPVFTGYFGTLFS